MNAPLPVEAARGWIAELLDRMGVAASVEAREEGDEVVVDVDTPDRALVVGPKGRTLDAIQHLATKAVARATGVRALVLVDVGGYRTRREEALRATAIERANEALRSGRAADLEPMSARERRIVHLVVAGLPGVRSASDGEGEARRVRIIPIDDDPSRR